MAALWIVGAVVTVAALALWALLEGIHERLRAIEERLDRIASLLGQRPDGAGRPGGEG